MALARLQTPTIAATPGPSIPDPDPVMRTVEPPLAEDGNFPLAPFVAPSWRLSLPGRPYFEEASEMEPEWADGYLIAPQMRLAEEPAPQSPLRAGSLECLPSMAAPPEARGMSVEPGFPEDIGAGTRQPVMWEAPADLAPEPADPGEETEFERRLPENAAPHEAVGQLLVVGAAPAVSANARLVPFLGQAEPLPQSLQGRIRLIFPDPAQTPIGRRWPAVGPAPISRRIAVPDELSGFVSGDFDAIGGGPPRLTGEAPRWAYYVPLEPRRPGLTLSLDVQRPVAGFPAGPKLLALPQRDSAEARALRSADEPIPMQAVGMEARSGWPVLRHDKAGRTRKIPPVRKALWPDAPPVRMHSGRPPEPATCAFPSATESWDVL
jgi:hypothetical protein